MPAANQPVKPGKHPTHMKIYCINLYNENPYLSVDTVIVI